MSRDVEIREIKPVTSDELNYVRRLFFSENNTFGHNCQWQRNKNHMKEGTTIASRNVSEMLSQVLSPAINSQSKEQLRSFPRKRSTADNEYYRQKTNLRQRTLDEMVSSEQTPPFQPKVLLQCTGCVSFACACQALERVGKGDRFTFLGNCPPTPPLNQH